MGRKVLRVTKKSTQQKVVGRKLKMGLVVLQVLVVAAIIYQFSPKYPQLLVPSGMTKTATNHLSSSPSYIDDSPEPLDWMEICAEKCKHIPEMCTNGLYKETHWPAPQCKYRSTDLEGDHYYNNATLAKQRQEMSIRLVQWAAKKIRKPESEGGVPCESHVTDHVPPMMWPEEFEMLVKTLARLRPETYLEWGTGRSTSFYPLLNSGKAYAIDNYPPWCEEVSTDPVVSCMVNQQKRLTFICAAPMHEDGSPIQTESLGYPARGSTREVFQMYADQYLAALDRLGDEVNHRFDAVLIDGRLRVAAALKVLHYVDDTKSVVILHDFWLRREYLVVLDYYDVLGYARSLAVLRKKVPEKLPVGWETAWKVFANMTTHEPL